MPEVDAGEVSRGNLRVHCPQCHGTFGVGHSASLREITCSSCGFAFSLVNETETVSHQAKKWKLGHFELLDHLGMGQFGNVWRAHDSILDRIVALKIPRGEHLDDELFFREARAAAQLQHPNIVSVHEVGQEGDTVYIACDFVQGANLQKPPERRYLTAAQLAADLLQKGDGHFEDLQLTVTLVDMAASTVWGMRFVSLLLLAMLAAAVYLTYI